MECEILSLNCKSLQKKVSHSTLKDIGRKKINNCKSDLLVHDDKMISKSLHKHTEINLLHEIRGNKQMQMFVVWYSFSKAFQ